MHTMIKILYLKKKFILRVKVLRDSIVSTSPAKNQLYLRVVTAAEEVEAEKVIQHSVYLRSFSHIFEQQAPPNTYPPYLSMI